MENLREFIRNFLTSNSSMCIVDTSIFENIRQFNWQAMFLQSALPRNYYMNLGWLFSKIAHLLKSAKFLCSNPANVISRALRPSLATIYKTKVKYK